MLDSFHASLLFRSLKLHFTTEKYNYFAYNGRIRGDSIAAKNKFEATKTKFFYASLGKHPDPEGLLVANFLAEPRAFIIDIVGDKGYNVYSDWLSRKASLHYRFAQELEHFDSIKEFKEVTDSGLPLLIEKYLEGNVSPETVVILDSCIHKLDEWAQLKHPLLDQTILKLRKYKPFVSYDKKKVRSTILKTYTISAK